LSGDDAGRHRKPDSECSGFAGERDRGSGERARHSA
jgi:hypothetical protein